MTTFKHPADFRNQEQVVNVRINHGAEGYGILLMLLERITAFGREKANYDAIGYDFRVSAQKVRDIIEKSGIFDTFDTEEGKFYNVKGTFYEQLKFQSVNIR